MPPQPAARAPTGHTITAKGGRPEKPAGDANAVSEAMSKFFNVELEPHDPDWFIKRYKGFPNETLWDPGQILVDIPSGLFADMMYNSQKSTLYGAMVFAFSVACVLLWIIGEGLWTDEDLQPKYNIAYSRYEPLPSKMLTLEPHNVTLRLTDENTEDAVPIGVEGATATLYAFPAERFNLPLYYLTLDSITEQIPTRQVDCLKHMVGDRTLWSFQDEMLCKVPLSATTAVSNSSGHVRFENLRVRGGPKVLLAVVVRITVPGRTQPVFKQQYVEHDTPIYTWRDLGRVRVDSEDEKLRAGAMSDRPIDIFYKLYMVFKGPLPQQEELRTRMNTLSCPPVTAAVDGRQLLVPEFRPMDDPSRDKLAEFEILQTEVLDSFTQPSGHEERSFETYVPELDAHIWEQVFRVRVRAKWIVGRVVYPALFIGPGLLYVGFTPIENIFAEPSAIYRPIGVAPRQPRPALTMATALPHALVEGVAFTVRIDVGPGARNFTTAFRPAVLARLVSYGNDALDGSLPDYWLDPANDDVRQTFKEIQGTVGVAQEDPSTPGSWYIELKFAFSTRGLVGRYGVVFEWEEGAKVVPKVAPHNNSTASSSNAIRTGLSADGLVWLVDVRSAVCNATSSFLSAFKLVTSPGNILEGLKFVVGDGSTHIGFSPSFQVLDCDGFPLSGKTVRVAAENATELGVSARSLEADADGHVAFSEYQITYAMRDGDHNVVFYVDHVVVMRLTLPVVVAATASASRPMHVVVCNLRHHVGAPVTPEACRANQLAPLDLMQYRTNVTVLVVNARGDPIAGVPAWSRVAYLDRHVPPVGFSADADPGTLGERQSTRVTTNADGIAVLPMSHVGGPCIAPLSFMARAIDASRMFPAGGAVGGLLMTWPGRVEAVGAAASNGNADDDDDASDGTVFENREGSRPGEYIVHAMNPRLPIKLVAVQYPARLKLVAGVDGLSAPVSGTAHAVDLVVDGIAAPGTYLFSVFADGRWLSDLHFVIAETPVASIEIVTSTAVRDDDGNTPSRTLADGREFETMHSDGTPFAQQPAVRFLDADGNPVAGAVATAHLVGATFLDNGVLPYNGDAYRNPLYAPSSALAAGCLIEVEGLRNGSFSLAVMRQLAAALKASLQAEGLGNGLGSDLVFLEELGIDVRGIAASGSGGMPEVTAQVLREMRAFPLAPAVSPKSGPDGIATFAHLAAINPRVDTPAYLVYTYSHLGERSMSDATWVPITASESTLRVGDRAYRGQVLTPPQPVATPGAAFAVPPSAIMLDDQDTILPFLVGTANPVPGTIERRTAYTNLNRRSVLLGTGALVLDGLTLTAASDLGRFALEYRLPGFGILRTSEFSVVRAPHMLEVINMNDTLTTMLGGSVAIFKVMAKLADGSPVHGASITASSKMYDDKGNRVCRTCELPKALAITDRQGIAHFRVPTEGAITAFYRVTFTASNGLARFVNAQAALEGARDAFAAGVDELEDMFESQVGVLAPFLDDMFSHGSAFVEDFLFTQAILELDSVSAESSMLLVYSGVSAVNVVVEPVKNPLEVRIRSGPLRDLYNCTFNVAAVLSVWAVEQPLPDYGLTQLVVRDRATGETLPAKQVQYDITRSMSNATGHLTLYDLWLVAPPGTYDLEFEIRGTTTSPADPVVVDGGLKKEKVPSVYERAAVIIILLLPWLFANVPYASVYWVIMSFFLAAGLPGWMEMQMPNIFRANTSFVIFCLITTAILWLLIIFALVYEVVRLVRGTPSQATTRVINDYRYVRWLTRLIPFSPATDVDAHEFECAVDKAGVLSNVLLFAYRKVMGEHLDNPDVPVATHPHRRNISWVQNGEGSLSLHRDPRLYHNPDAALLHEYGVFFPAETKRAEVAVRLAGAYADQLAPLATDVAVDLAALTGIADVADVQIAESSVGGAYAVATFTIPDDPEADVEADTKADAHTKDGPDGGDNAAKAKTAAKRGSDSTATGELAGKLHALAGAVLPATSSRWRSDVDVITVEAVLTFTPGALRRDNDPEWTRRDTMVVKWHFNAVPLMVEEERFVDESDSPTRVAVVGVQPCVRVWIRHRLPRGIRRSNGESFPDFWSPSCDMESSRVLAENDPDGKPFVPLDVIKPDGGGRPDDIESPVRIPFRFAVAAAICLIIVAFLAAYAFFLVGNLRDVLREFSLKIPDPEADGKMTADERDSLNTQLRFQLTYAINIIASVNVNLASIRSWIPVVEDIDFAAGWHALHTIARDTLNSVEDAAFMAKLVAPFLSFSGWLILVLETPRYIGRLRRNAPDEPELREIAQCYTADYYLGMQALGGAVNYVIIFSVLFLIGLILFNDSLLPWVWRELRTVVISALIAGIVQYLIMFTTQFIWAPRMTVRYPHIYSKVMVASAVISIVGGAVQTVVRLALSLATQLVLFPRLDVRSVPSAFFGRFDKGYWSYWSMLYVDEMHNNPILRVFCSMVVTDTLVRKAAEGSTEVCRPSFDDDQRGSTTALVRIVARGRRGVGGVGQQRYTKRHRSAKERERAQKAKNGAIDDRSSDDEADAAPCAIGGLRVFVDCELVSSGGRPFAKHVAAASSLCSAADNGSGWGGDGQRERDLRYFRSPLPRGPAAHGCGCYLCGTPPGDLPECHTAPDEPLRYLRVVTRAVPVGSGGGDIADVYVPQDTPDARYTDWRGRIRVVAGTPVPDTDALPAAAATEPGGNAIEIETIPINGAWAAVLPTPIPRGAVEAFAVVAGLGATAATTTGSQASDIGSEDGLGFAGMADAAPHALADADTADDSDVEYTTDGWLVLASSDGQLWNVLHDGATEDGAVPEGPAVLNARSALVVCERCHARRRPAEGAPRVLVPVPCRLLSTPDVSFLEDPLAITVGVGRSFVAEITLPSSECRVRGYSICTSMAEPEHDMSSWTFAIAYTSEEAYLANPEEVRWNVHHDVTAAPVTLMRGAYTTRYGVWPTPAIRLDWRRQALSMMEYQYPFMKELVRTRLLHILGVASASLGDRDVDDVDKDELHGGGGAAADDGKRGPGNTDSPTPSRASEPDQSDGVAHEVEMSRVGGSSRQQPRRVGRLYVSQLERSAHRNARCHHSRWAMAFLLTMNPSLLPLRKTLSRRVASIDTLRVNTAALRKRVDRGYWRSTELQDTDSGAQSKPAELTASMQAASCVSPRSDTGAVTATGCHVSITCTGNDTAAAFFDGEYTREEERRSLRVRVNPASGAACVAAPEPVVRVTAAAVRGTTDVDVTDAVSARVTATGCLCVEVRVASALKECGGDAGGSPHHVVDVAPLTPGVPWAAGDGTSLCFSERRDATLHGSALPTDSAGSTAQWVDVYYTTPVYRRSTLRTCWTYGARTAVPAMCDAVLRYQDGAWRVAPGVPARGDTYPCLMNEPTGGLTLSTLSEDGWVFYNSARRVWEDVVVTLGGVQGVGAAGATAGGAAASLDDVGIEFRAPVGEGDASKESEYDAPLHTPIVSADDENIPRHTLGDSTGTEGAGTMADVAQLIVEASKVDLDGLLMVLVDHCKAEDAEAVVALFEDAAGEVNVVGRAGRTALLEAARYGREELCSALVHHGAALDHQDDSGTSALMEASRSGHTRVAALLLQCGAAVDICDGDGWAALHHAAVQGHKAIVLLLIAHGADPQRLTHAGLLAEHYAEQQSHAEVIQVLSAAGADGGLVA